MVRFELGTEDLAWTRFGISPLAEATRSLLVVSDPGPRPISKARNFRHYGRPDRLGTDNSGCRREIRN
jgi:hypothetical protein